MRRQTSKHSISVTLTDSIQLEERELRFLRMMAQHCRETRMMGGAASDRLDELLEKMGVPVYNPNTDGPCYDVFEDER